MRGTRDAILPSRGGRSAVCRLKKKRQFIGASPAGHAGHWESHVRCPSAICFASRSPSHDGYSSAHVTSTTWQPAR